MYLHLIFLFLALLAIDTVPEGSNAPFQGLSLLLLLYGTTLGVVAMMKKTLQKPFWRLNLGLGTLLAFILISIYLVHLPSLFSSYTKTLTGSLLVLAYFLGVYLLTSWPQVRFYLPFALPFILYLFAAESLLPFTHPLLFYMLLGLLFIAVFIFIPLLFKFFWGCQPLPDSPLRDKLETLCRQCHFKHGGLKLWIQMREAVTAAIIGVIPHFRYILFTEKLMKTFSDEEIEAVLAHEIGHSKYKHLLLYPWLLLGTLPMNEALLQATAILPPILSYFLIALCFLLYFRYFFGYFSRSFEAQADTYILTLGKPASSLISAFEKLAYLHSVPLNKSNWHHGSFQERIDYLRRAEDNPHLISRTQRKLVVFLGIYSFVFILSCYYFLRRG